MKSNEIRKTKYNIEEISSAQPFVDQSIEEEKSFLTFILNQRQISCRLSLLSLCLSAYPLSLTSPFIILIRISIVDLNLSHSSGSSSPRSIIIIQDSSLYIPIDLAWNHRNCNKHLK